MRDLHLNLNKFEPLPLVIYNYPVYNLGWSNSEEKYKLINKAMAVKKYRLTAQKIEELQTELSELETKGRTKIADRLSRLRSITQDEMETGISEVLEDKNSLEKRIYEIKDILSNHEVVEHEKDLDTVDIGAKVKVGFEGFEAVYQIVSSVEADPLNGKISEESAVGSALLNAKVGDEIEVDNGMVKKIYRVLDIS